MASISQQTETTLTRKKMMESREAEAQRLRVRWALAAEEKKQRHKEALEYARRTPINEKDDSNA
tara:strand:+ start:342 stop:533 length:192 start_codon:yes stop_codon:yes gene_type:complete